MYEAFFGLREKPFSILPDPRFLFLSQHHRTAYAMLEYGIVHQAGFTVITGEIGSGKTTLLRQVINTLEGDVILGTISNTGSLSGGLLEWVLMAFGRPFENLTYPRLFKDFQTFLSEVEASGRRAVLAIDEAQNLEKERLEELRMLSNANIDTMMLQLILVGQPELRDLLRGPGLSQFAQRVSSDYHLLPLELKDTIKYIDHRLMVAGGSPSTFTRGSKKLIHQASGGVPRTINILADRCLVYAFGMERPVVRTNTTAAVINDIRQYGTTIADQITVQSTNSLQSTPASP